MSTGHPKLVTFRQVAAWLAVAMIVVFPRGGLTGDPNVDVWNHAWGYWWFAESFRQLSFPWHTGLLGAPAGGTLWFIDPVGAAAALPLTLGFGPAVGFQAAILARVALAGRAAQGLAAEVWGEGPHTWFAGVAYVTSPMLLCELHNGITEVIAIAGVPLVLWCALRATRLQTRRSWLWLGVALGLSVVTNFYYGLLGALLVTGIVIARIRHVSPRQVGLAVLVAAALALPAVAALHASVVAPDALILRTQGLDRALAAHNAVDPRVYVTPGDFWSVNLAARYGESFRHTGYLRLSALGLALVAVVWRWRTHRSTLVLLAAVTLGSLVLGLGPQLWWKGKFLVVGNGPILLPFGFLQRIVPELAITHPLRFSVAAQAAVAVLAAGALVGGRSRALVATVLVATEGAFGSVARWPVEESPIEVPALYQEIAASDDPRAVLDLPGDIGTSMATSRYFWFQTVHHHPVPYKPDARANDTGDPLTFSALPDRLANTTPDALLPATIAHLHGVYGWVVVHPDLDAKTGHPGRLRALLEQALGPPESRDGLLVWRLAPAGG